MKSLPRYKSHKIVEAAKIATIGVGRDGNHRLFRSLADGAVTPGIIVTAQYMEKHNPQKGGYYVRYPDGYESRGRRRRLSRKATRWSMSSR